MNQERIQKLEALLDRIRRNRTARPARSTPTANGPIALEALAPAVAPPVATPPAVAPLAVTPAAPPVATPIAQPVAATSTPSVPPEEDIPTAAPPPIATSSWQPEPGSAVQARPSTVPPTELAEDDLVDITTLPPAPAEAEGSSIEAAAPELEVVESEVEEEQPPASSSRSKVAESLDETIRGAAAAESDREIPAQTPPPESGPQEAMPATGLESPRIPDVENLEADLSGPPSMGPTAEQLGETIELEAPRGPELEIDVAVSEPHVPAPAEELEVTLPRPSMQSGLYDVSIAAPAPEPAVTAPPAALTAVTVPAAAGHEGPERTGRPALGATDVAAVKLATPSAARTFVELLDASLGL